MEFLELSGYILLFCGLIGLVFYYRYNKKQIYNRSIKLKRQLKELSNQIRKEIEIEKQNRDKQREKDNKEIEELEQKIKQLNEDYSNKRLSIDQDIQEWSQSAQNAASMVARQNQEKLETEIQGYTQNLQEIQNKLNDAKESIAAINNANAALKEKLEEIKFYQIQLDEETQEDLSILFSIKPKISKIEFFNKFIYDNYIKKPVEEMIKRVIQNKEISGIYKITNIETKESYIGKSTNIKNRWTNHVKSAYGLEGVSDSQFQRALKKYGVTKFIWEIVEEVPKDKLTEKEKFYIDFYGTTKFGYNMKIG